MNIIPLDLNVCEPKCVRKIWFRVLDFILLPYMKNQMNKVCNILYSVFKNVYEKMSVRGGKSFIWEGFFRLPFHSKFTTRIRFLIIKKSGLKEVHGIVDIFVIFVYLYLRMVSILLINEYGKSTSESGSSAHSKKKN